MARQVLILLCLCLYISIVGSPTSNNAGNFVSFNFFSFVNIETSNTTPSIGNVRNFRLVLNRRVVFSAQNNFAANTATLKQSHCTRIAIFINLKPTSGTDPDFIFIFIEPTSLSFFQERCVNGLGLTRLMHTKSILTLVYTNVVSLHYISCFLHFKIFKLTLGHIGGNARKRRKCMAAIEYRLRLSFLVALVLLLLICGDVHPNPGPVFSGNSRHPDLQLVVMGAWNVRTLLETKRTPIRPSAIVARRLDEMGVDIAALSETRQLGDTVFQEKGGGGYTFFLKGKPIGDKHYHGVGFAIRTKLIDSLDGNFPKGINERLMTMSIPLEGSTLSII